MYTQTSKAVQNRSFRHVFHQISHFKAKWQDWRREEKQPHYRLAPTQHTVSAFPPYAIDMWPLLALPFGTLNEAGVPYNDKQIGEYPTMYHPTAIAQYALAHWNAYIATEDQKHRQAFMAQANWLV